ncbi:MAG: formimidoylglutamase [Saonia sp.]
MSGYKKTNPEVWTGRTSEQELSLHEKVKFIDLEKEKTGKTPKSTIALLGYACDEGVKRNQGRTGAAKGPDVIRHQLGKLPNHLKEQTVLLDTGTIACTDSDMEKAQAHLAEKVALLLKKNTFLILMGGGHDIAYGHYLGLKKYLGGKTLGIINLDAHFDLRSNETGNNSGTPFYQIAQDHKVEKTTFHYLVLGIRKDANTSVLFETAKKLGVHYIENETFNMHHLRDVKTTIGRFISEVDHIYLTIDLDGFSSAYAPGVSAPSPMGFAPDIVLEAFKDIIDSKKLISLDIAELNPTYDRDDQTAKLAASLIHFVIHKI